MWYTASLLFKSTRSKPENGEPIWEESIRLIEADSGGDARRKATELGRRSEVSYPVEGSDSTKWTFVQVERICEIDAEILADGVEVFSRFLRSSEVESILKPID